MIRCGFSQNIITPLGEGIFMDGYGHRMSPASDVHDDLYAKAAVFETADGRRFAIIVLDTLGVSSEIYTLITDYIEAMTGLDKSQTAVCGIHSHSGPAGGMIDGLPVNYDYWCHTAEICGRTISEALDNLCECHCSSAIADSEILSSLNRRDRPFIDRRIRVSVFTGTDGLVRGVISNACCHPVINTSQSMTADYPHVLTRRALEEYGVPFLFLLGRSADINPLPELMGSWEGMETVGNELSDGVLNAVQKSGDCSWSADFIQSAYKSAVIPMKHFPSPEDAKKSFQKHLKKYTELAWSLDKHYALRELEWHRHIYEKVRQNKASGLCVPIQVFSIGKRIIFVFIPFETFTNTGNKIENFLLSLGYTAENIYVVSCANSVNGYLAPQEEFAVGGYEISGAAHWYGLPECSELSERAVLDAIKELIREVESR